MQMLQYFKGNSDFALNDVNFVMRIRCKRRNHVNRTITYTIIADAHPRRVTVFVLMGGLGFTAMFLVQKENTGKIVRKNAPAGMELHVITEQVL